MLDLSCTDGKDYVPLTSTTQSYDEEAFAAALSQWKKLPTSRTDEVKGKNKSSRPRPRSAEAPFHSQMVFAAFAAENKKLNSLTGKKKSKSSKKEDSKNRKNVQLEADEPDSPYSRVPKFMRTSMSIAARNRMTSERDEPRTQVLGRRRMGIADIDPYQLQRLSETVGGFNEEEAATSSTAKSPRAKRKDSKAKRLSTKTKS